MTFSSHQLPTRHKLWRAESDPLCQNYVGREAVRSAMFGTLVLLSEKFFQMLPLKCGKIMIESACLQQHPKMYSTFPITSKKQTLINHAGVKAELAFSGCH